MKRASRRPRRNPSPLDNPAFRRWFGASKVVDENGEPLVVYHGTAANFDAFDSSRYGEASDAGTLGSGFYFTSLRAAAESYASAAAEKSGGIPRVVEVYLSIQRPYVAPRRIWNLSHDLPAARKHSASLRRQGHDGIAFKVDLSALGEPVFMEYVAFSPTQIKSATDNVGTYNPDDPSILKNGSSPLDNPAFRRWFGTSEVVDENGEPRVMYHATFSPFTTFRVDHLRDEYHRFGFHVGPEDAAMMRIEVKLAESARDRVKESRDKARLMPLYVRAEAPLRLDENRTGRWGVDDVMAALMQKADSEGIDGVSDDMLDDYHEDALVLPRSGGRLWADHHEFRDGERSAILINFLRELGYDSIIYQNEFEGGGDSYLLLDPRQVKSATDNAGTYDPIDPSILKNPAFPTALYHATPQRNLDSILQRGLLASKSSVTLSSGGGVFLTDEKSLARGYAERRFGVDDYDEPWLLLKIDPVQLDPSRFEADPGQEAELNAEDIEARGYTILTMPWWVSLEETGQMVYAGDVPPGAIEPVEIMLPSKGDSWEPVRVQRNRRSSRPKRTSRRRR